MRVKVHAYPDELMFSYFAANWDANQETAGVFYGCLLDNERYLVHLMRPNDRIPKQAITHRVVYHLGKRKPYLRFWCPKASPLHPVFMDHQVLFAQRRKGYGGNVYLHHAVLALDEYRVPKGQGYERHHLNGNSLDNRHCNIAVLRGTVHDAFHMDFPPQAKLAGTGLAGYLAVTPK